MNLPRRPQPLFWFKTILHRVLPGGFGHYRTHRQHRDPDYVHDRDKHPVRHKHHGKGGWKEAGGDGIAQRDYASYEEYLTHQKLKLEEMLKMYGGFRGEDIFNYRRRFYARFKHLPRLLPRDARILCLGARQGTEVEVLRDLGFRNAWGIDLNPGPDNPFVRPGDFMKLDAPDDSLDLIYSNCVDHAFDLPGFFREHARALKPDGYAIYDLGVNMEEGGGAFEAVAWDRTEDVFQMLLRHFRKLIRVERETQWMWILLQGKTPPPPDAR
jgi:SAM-dependent methyltransferase